MMKKAMSQSAFVRSKSSLSQRAWAGRLAIQIVRIQADEVDASVVER